MAKAALWNGTDAETRKRGERTGLDTPGSPRRKRWALGVGGVDSFRAAANVLARRTGSTAARLKLKGIDGGPHKQRSMWF